MFLLFNSKPIFLRFIPKASLEDRNKITGRWFRNCAFAAIRTGVSVMPFASFARVFPVHGAIKSAKKGAFGPIGSASFMVVMQVF